MIDFKITGLDSFIKDIEKEASGIRRKAILRLSRIGEMYIEQARSHKGLKKEGKGNDYEDQTTNLRNANSYAVYEDGIPIFENFGRPETQAFFESKKNGLGLELIVGNGMEYASFVEGKNFDVCSSGFLKVESEVRKLMK